MFKIDTLRKKALKLSRENFTLKFFTYQTTEKDYGAMLKFEEIIKDFPKKELADLILDFEKNIMFFSNRFGLLVPLDKLNSLLTKAEKDEEKYILVFKYELDKYFRDYKYILREPDKYVEFPKRARLGFQLFRSEKAHPMFFQLEASIYDDLLFKYTILHTIPHSDDKKKSSIYRSLIITTFMLLETYLNGIAFDFTKSGVDIDPKNLDILKDEHGNLKLKEKIVKYPRIILGLQHPILDETNCSEIDWIINKGKKFRDSFIHPSYFVKYYQKEHFFHNVTKTDVDEAVTNTINLIQKIDNQINAHQLWWLHDKDMLPL